MKHPAKYIGKKPRKYTIPAKPLAPNINDQVRIYSTNSTSGDGQVMHNTHSSQYLRVRLNLQKFRENNRHFLRVMPLLEYYSNTCSELLCVVCQFLISVLEPFFSISTWILYTLQHIISSQDYSIWFLTESSWLGFFGMLARKPGFS